MCGYASRILRNLHGDEVNARGTGVREIDGVGWYRLEKRKISHATT